MTSKARYHAAFEPGEERQWLDSIIATVADAVVCSDAAGNVELYNPAAEQIFQWTPEEVLGRNVSMLMPGPHAARHDEYMHRYLSGATPRVIGVGRETLGMRRDGTVFPMSLSMTEGTAGKRRIFTAVIRDITEHKRNLDELERYRRDLEELVARRTAALEEANRRLETLALEDPLTGIANRRRFEDAFLVEVRRAHRASSPLSLLMCDVDSFKAYNDCYGHDLGDRCLCEVADVLKRSGRRAADLAARIGGEEFVVLLPDTAGEVAVVVAEELRRAMWNRGIEHRAAALGRVTVSIGVAALGPGDPPAAAAELLARADRALYRAKSAGRNTVVHG